MNTEDRCCGQPMAIVPSRHEDQALGFDYLMLCYECGHHEPYDVAGADDAGAGERS